MDAYDLHRPESPAVDVLAAKRLIDGAIRNSMDAIDMDGKQWSRQVMSALGAEAHEGIARGISVAIAAIANALQHVAPGDIQVVKEDALNQMMEVLLHIPRVDDFTMATQGHGPESPTGDELAQQLAVADSLYHAVATSTARSPPLALNQAITGLTEACRTCLRRLEWLRKTADDEMSKRQRLDDIAVNLELVGQALSMRLQQGRGTVATTEHEMTIAQTAFRGHSAALKAAIDACRSEFVAQGMEPLDAKLDANAEIFLSTVPAILHKRVARAASRRQVVARKADVVRANAHLVFLQTLQRLFKVVAKERARCNQRVIAHFDTVERFASRRDARERVTGHLRECVPKLKKVLCWHFKFFSTRQLRADRERQVLEEALNEDLAPSIREEVQTRLREFSEVRAQAAGQIREVVRAQAALWAGASGVLPHKLKAAIVDHYAGLAEGLSSEAREVLRENLAALQHGGCALWAPMTRAPLRLSAGPPLVIDLTEGDGGAGFDANVGRIDSGVPPSDLAPTLAAADGSVAGSGVDVSIPRGENEEGEGEGARLSEAVESAPPGQCAII